MIEREDFQELQGYLKPASEYGIDAEYAWTIPGGTGKNVTITDIEYATWNLDHEDLKGTRICFAQNGSGLPFDFTDDHGSGVIGVMVSNDNGFGMKGVVHDASLLVINHANSEQNFAAAIASAIEEAMSRLNPGDVVLIEANTDGQNGVVEHERPVYDAIVKAVAAGLIVLETAGNGGANLDDAPTFGDSGAIFVGGGTSAKTMTPLAPMNLNYGSRIDLQAGGRMWRRSGAVDSPAITPRRATTWLIPESARMKARRIVRTSLTATTSRALPARARSWPALQQ